MVHHIMDHLIFLLRRDVDKIKKDLLTCRAFSFGQIIIKRIIGNGQKGFVFFKIFFKKICDGVDSVNPIRQVCDINLGVGVR